MANESEATVIFLESHPRWLAAQRARRERVEAIGRHPSVVARRRAHARDRDIAVGMRAMRSYSSGDTPA
ncbi:hypothetical protein AWC23_19870 [Mycobacterium saskatchewanense]|uniref:Uncharacterized protein n=1 Tax=Mycobacterium saskatchewanense TaxID=220927 RepID=A0AAJ3NN78_9MYCO|nr:hypothetical protein AWC23_19870 [Mycobacterium saskatchewanense]